MNTDTSYTKHTSLSARHTAPLFLSAVLCILASPSISLAQMKIGDNPTSINPATQLHIEKAGLHTVILDNGNVGIGTVNPKQQLHVNGGTSYGIVQVGIAGTGNTNASLDLVSYNGHTHALGESSAKGYQILTRSNAYSVTSEQNDLMMYYWNGATWRNDLTVDSATGNVGIGTIGPTYKLEINGDMSAKSYKVPVYTVGGPTAGAFTFNNSNTWSDTDLSLSIPLTSAATVTCTYSISVVSPGSVHFVTRLVIDGAIKTRTLTGNTQYWGNSETYSQQLSVGSHTIKVQYRTPDTSTNNPSADDWQNRILQCTVYGNQ